MRAYKIIQWQPFARKALVDGSNKMVKITHSQNVLSAIPDIWASKYGRVSLTAVEIIDLPPQKTKNKTMQASTLTGTTLEEALTQCQTLIIGIMGDLHTAGVAIANACDQHDGFIKALKAKLGTNVTLTYLRRLERLGRGEICTQVAMGTVPHVSLVERLPLSQQIDVIKNGVKFPVGPDGDHRILTLDVMDYLQAKAAFNGDTIGSVEEIQAAYIALNTQRIAESEAHRKRTNDEEEKSRQRAQRVLDKVNGSVSITKHGPLLSMGAATKLTLNQLRDILGYMAWLE